MRIRYYLRIVSVFIASHRAYFGEEAITPNTLPIHLRHVYSSRVVAGRSLQVKYVQNTNTNTIQIHRAIHVFSVLVCIFQRKCQLHGGQNGGFQVLRTRHELEKYKQYKGRYNGADYANTKQIRSKYGPSCALPIQPKYHAQYQHNT